jgi:VIT1/CCC1 family predicted Fe2+/Mn2+ transporter
VISGDELRHYGIWKGFSKVEVKPDVFKLWFYIIISRIFGATFGLKLMESGEEMAQGVYEKIAAVIPDAADIKKDEDEHESQLVNMIDEEKLKYIGSVVLGLNDALVELTGTLAGLTFALQNTRLVGMAGMITGIAASLSMAASEYLSTKTEGGEKNPLKASIYTGITYVGAVLVLIIPYFIFQNYYLSLGSALAGAIILIYLFTFYFSVVRDISFKRRFLEMVFVSLGVATLSFVIGLAVRFLLGIQI